MTRRLRAYQNYLVLLLAPVAVFGAALGLSLLFLVQGEELRDLSDIVGRQQRSGGLYGSAIHDDVYQYKLALAAQRKPVVAVIGSSRVLTIPQAFFTAPMANLGLMVNSAEQLEVAVDDLLRVSRPEALIIGIDFFWANPQWIGPINLVNQASENRRAITPGKLVAPYRWLLQGLVSPNTFAASILGAAPGILNVPTQGWMARLNGDGYSPEGEWIYGATIYGRRPAADEAFANTFGRIAAGSSQFGHASAADGKAVAAIRRALARLREAGIKVVTYLPPLAPQALEKMAAMPPRFGYVAEFRRAMREASPFHLDALDMRPFGGGDCEFVDGFHPGEVATARILLALAESPVGPYLDKHGLDRAIRSRAGFVTFDRRYANPGETETDFLKIGCSKPAAR